MPSPSESAIDHCTDTQSLSISVERLEQQILVLRKAIDELREEVPWAFRNDRLVVWPTSVYLKHHQRQNGRPAVVPLAASGKENEASEGMEQPLREEIEQTQEYFAGIAMHQLECFFGELHDAEKRIRKLLQGDDGKGNSPERELPFDEGQSEEEVATDEKPACSVAAGESVTFYLDGHEYMGEVLAVDGDAGTADICLTPTMETMTVELSVLEESRSDNPNASLSDDAGKKCFSDFIPSLEQRKAEFDQWCRDVRDPAGENSEGERIVKVNGGKATVSYEIAPLPGGSWAIRYGFQYHCGDLEERGVPWTECHSREEGLETMLKSARQFFATKKPNPRQQSAAIKMQERLGDGLFGFPEPEVETEE